MINNFFNKKEAVNAMEGHDDDFLELNSDAYTKLGWGIILLGVVGFFLWASLAPLDKGVPLSGNVAVASSRKVIQHQTGGTVDEILVKNGDLVETGQVLLRMNSVGASSAAEISRVQWYTAQASQARLQAESDSAKSISFAPELLLASADPRAVSSIALQQQLFSSRQSSLRNELAAADENIAGLKAQLSSLKDAMLSKKKQQQFLKEQLGGMRILAKEGYVANNRLLELEGSFAQVNGGISEDIGNIIRVERQIIEFGLRKLQRQQDYQKEVRSQLADVKRDAEALHNKLTALDFDLKKIFVRAPVAGTVVDLKVFTEGAVVAPGGSLMELVPKDDTLVVEGKLPVQLVDKVHQGLAVELIFSAFNAATTPNIPGIVTRVSADRTVDERTGEAYYKVRAAVALEGVKMLAHLEIRPGMPVELFIITGERTMMNYLLKPVFDRAQSAMAEE
jgi:protease secretion system membrane fusion protein